MSGNNKELSEAAKANLAKDITDTMTTTNQGRQPSTNQATPLQRISEWIPFVIGLFAMTMTAVGFWLDFEESRDYL